NHSPLAKDIEGVVRYQTVYPTDPDNAEFDGVAELYFETRAEERRVGDERRSRESGPNREVAAQARKRGNKRLGDEEHRWSIGVEQVGKNVVEGETDGL